MGPYPGTLTGSILLAFYCMDMDLPASWNTAYNGSDANPLTQSEIEAAYLATLDQYLGGMSTNQTFINIVVGPISLAIWELIGNMGSYPNDPAAQQYIQQAQYAWNDLLNNPQDTQAQKPIVQNWKANVLIFTPTVSGTQHFPASMRKKPDCGAQERNFISLPNRPDFAAQKLIFLRRLHAKLMKTREFPNIS